METPAESSSTAEKVMSLRYAGTCRVCGTELPAGTRAVFEKAARTVRCLTHGQDRTDTSTPDSPTTGVAGASARRELERRQRGREERIRAAHPRLGGVILALSDDPQSTRAWGTGARGEELLGARLSELSVRHPDTVRVLHDRRIPSSRANIDHLVVTPSGVWVVDAKKYAGRPTLKVEGGLLRPRTEKLLVCGRDRTTLLDGVQRQVAVVRSALEDAGLGPSSDRPHVHGALCFVEADWPLIGGAFTAAGVHVLWPKKLVAHLLAPGSLATHDIAELHDALGGALPPA